MKKSEHKKCKNRSCCYWRGALTRWSKVKSSEVPALLLWSAQSSSLKGLTCQALCQDQCTGNHKFLESSGCQPGVLSTKQKQLPLLDAKSLYYNGPLPSHKCYWDFICGLEENFHDCMINPQLYPMEFCCELMIMSEVTSA